MPFLMWKWGISALEGLIILKIISEIFWIYDAVFRFESVIGSLLE